MDNILDYLISTCIWLTPRIIYVILVLSIYYYIFGFGVTFAMEDDLKAEFFTRWERAQSSIAYWTEQLKPVTDDYNVVAASPSSFTEDQQRQVMEAKLQTEHNIALEQRQLERLERQAAVGDYRLSTPTVIGKHGSDTAGLSTPSGGKRSRD